MKQIIINTKDVVKKHNRYWKKMIGSGHAYLALRQDYREHLKDVVENIGFEYIRFHGIFDENVGIYEEDAKGNSQYNFMQLNIIYDYLQEVGIKPCVELGFMPEDLKSDDKYHFRWRYRVNVSPPKDYDKWADLVHNLVMHLIDRYGIEEVLTWPFEVWNEPDLPQFWAGTQEEYYRLYEVTVKTIKNIDKRLQVGGPGTANPQKIIGLLDYIKENDIDMDFLTTHAYCTTWFLDGDDTKKSCFLPYKDFVKKAGTAKEILLNRGKADMPIYLTEWNSTPSSRDFSHDIPFIAPFICQCVRDNFDKLDAFSYWTFTDVFEERGPGNAEYHGGFGMITMNGIHKPSYNAYKMLNMLGDEFIYIDDEPVMVTKNGSDDIQILAWNHIHPDTEVEFYDGKIPDFNNYDNKQIIIKINQLQGQYQFKKYRIDNDNGNAYKKWIELGSPKYITQTQRVELKETMDMVLIEDKAIIIEDELNLEIELSPHSVELILIDRIK